MTKYFTKEQIMTVMGEQNLMLDDIWGIEQRLDEMPAANVVELKWTEEIKIPEYIDKEDAYFAVLENWSSDMLPGDFDDIIRAVPSADVAPVVHAQWEIPIFIDGNDALDPRVKCSECGEVEAALARWKYCPNCGARMDGGDKE